MGPQTDPAATGSIASGSPSNPCTMRGWRAYV
jgi:hypothetical protein